MSFLWQKLLASLSPGQLCVSCILLTCGAGMYGLKTFARDSEVSEIREQQLADSAFNYRIKQCEAIKAGTPSAAYADLVGGAMRKYHDKTGTVYPLPSCADL